MFGTVRCHSVVMFILEWSCVGGCGHVWSVHTTTTSPPPAFLLRGLVWPLLWPAVFTVAGIATSVQMVSFSHNVPGARPTKTVSDNYAPTSVSVGS